MHNKNGGALKRFVSSASDSRLEQATRSDIALPPEMPALSTLIDDLERVL